MGLVYTIGTNGESDNAFSRVLSFEPTPPHDDFVLLGRNKDTLSDSAHQPSSKFISGVFEIISAWEERKFLRNFVVKVETKTEFQFGYSTPNNLPPLIIKPRHLAVLAHLLGLKWEEFDPRIGKYLASGNFQYLTSFDISGHALPCVEYTVSPFGSPNFSGLNNPNLTLPTSAASQFLFGYIPPFPPLSLPGFEIGSIRAVYETADKLDPKGDTSKKIKGTRHFMPHHTLGFSDIIPFTAPWFRIRGCEISRLASPAEYTGGLTRSREGFQVFRLNLDACLRQSNKDNSKKYKWRKWVLERYDNLLSDFPADWECEQPSDSVNSVKRLHFLDHCQDVWEACTDYFKQNQPDTVQIGASPGFTYLDLVSAQIKHSVSYWGDAWARVKAKDKGEPPGCWIQEGAHLYWDYLDKVAITLEEKNKQIDKHHVREAWAVMMLRAFCWWRCHFVDQVGEREIQTSIIDPRYIGSETDVAVF